MRKYFAELVGTFVLTFFGCGAAAISGGIGGMLGILGIAMAFGLSIVAMAYAIGDVSGCHINPAVSIGFFCAGRMSGKDCILYIVFQCIGAILAAAALLLVVLNTSLGYVGTVGLGANGFGDYSQVGLSAAGAIFVEIVLTFVFVLVVLGVTGDSKTSHMGGIVIGLTLAFVHILGIPLTGTSVNPARSLGPALMLMPYDGGVAMSQLWVFIISPIIGGVIAALVWRVLVKPSQDLSIADDDVYVEEEIDEYEIPVADPRAANSEKEYVTAYAEANKADSAEKTTAPAEEAPANAAPAEASSKAADGGAKSEPPTSEKTALREDKEDAASDHKASGARKPTARKHEAKASAEAGSASENSAASVSAASVDDEADEIVKDIKASIKEDAHADAEDAPSKDGQK